MSYPSMIITDYLEVRFRWSEGRSYRRPTNWSYPRYRRQGRRINVLYAKIGRISVDGVAVGMEMSRLEQGLGLMSHRRLEAVMAGWLESGAGGHGCRRSSQGHYARAAKRLVLAYTMSEIKILRGEKNICCIQLSLPCDRYYGRLSCVTESACDQTRCRACTTPAPADASGHRFHTVLRNDTSAPYCDVLTQLPCACDLPHTDQRDGN